MLWLAYQDLGVVDALATSSGITKKESKMRWKGDRTTLLTQVALLYYEEGLTQREIARRLSISRSNISRLLTEARNEGIVEIKVKRPIMVSSDLRKALLERFALHEAMVLITGHRDFQESLEGLGRLAAEYLENTLKDDSILGISWGTAVYETVKALRPIAKPGVQVVQMIGGMGSVNPKIDGTELALRLGGVLSAHYRYLRAPLVVENGEVHKALLQEREVREALGIARRADIALVGIGSVVPAVSSLLRAGYLTMAEVKMAAEGGAVGDICAQHFDVHGHICQLELNERMIGITLPELMKIPRVIGVAGGVNKASAILGALRGGYLSVLVTDDVATREVLRLSESA